jgi:hypothetical protein
VNIIGLGMRGAVPRALVGVHWVYFPEEAYPFYRCTALSNFSPRMVPRPFEQWQMLCEVSESKYRRVEGGQEAAVELTVAGLLRAKLVLDRADIQTQWFRRYEYGYPVPYLDRDRHMHAANERLMALGIWSRGRFGSWKYEVANQDHSCMLGHDAVDAVLFGAPEDIFYDPNKVNSDYRPYSYAADPRTTAAGLAAEEKAAGAGAGGGAAAAAAAAPGAAGAGNRGVLHTFAQPPKPWGRTQSWHFVVSRCREPVEEWADQLIAAVPAAIEFQIYVYERCGGGFPEELANNQVCRFAMCVCYVVFSCVRFVCFVCFVCFV